jgi:voltage-gated potassium channel
MVIRKIKHAIFVIIEPSVGDSIVDKAFNIGMLLLIVLNIFAVILQTEEGLFQRYETQFYIFEVFSVIFFY